MSKLLKFTQIKHILNAAKSHSLLQTIFRSKTDINLAIFYI